MKNFVLLILAIPTVSFAEPRSDISLLSAYVSPPAADLFETVQKVGWIKESQTGTRTSYDVENGSIQVDRTHDTITGTDTAKGTKWAVTMDGNSVRSFSICEKANCLNASASSCHALYNLVQKIGESDFDKSAKNCQAMAKATADAKDAATKDAKSMSTWTSSMKGHVDKFPMQEPNVAVALDQIPKLYEICKKVAFAPDVNVLGASIYWKAPANDQLSELKSVD